jgi:AcrR family transcriptional regulator
MASRTKRHPGSGADPRVRAAATKRERTVKALVRSAEDAIMREGVGVKAEDIADGAGVSTATFYNVFPSRPVLLTVVYEFSITQASIARAAVEFPDGAPPRDQVRLRLEEITKRPPIVRGMLLARLESHATRRANQVTDLIGDPVEDLASDLVIVMFPADSDADRAGMPVANALVLGLMDDVVRGSQPKLDVWLEVFKRLVGEARLPSGPTSD